MTTSKEVSDVGIPKNMRPFLDLKLSPYFECFILFLGGGVVHHKIQMPGNYPKEITNVLPFVLGSKHAT